MTQLKLRNSELTSSNKQLNEELNKSKSTMDDLLCDLSSLKSELSKKSCEISGLTETVSSLDSKKVYAENLVIESNARYENAKIDQLKSDALRAKERVV